MRIADLPDPELTESRNVLIKITSGGICGSDIQIWNGTNSLASYPCVIGHEFGGIVVDVRPRRSSETNTGKQNTGAHGSGIHPGDLVSVDPVLSCGRCFACRTGHPNVCASLQVMGVHCQGGFSEYMAVPEENVHKFHTSFPPELVSLTEPYSIGTQVSERAGLSSGDQVLVMGCGPIGLTVLQAAKAKGASVIMSDLIPQRLDHARQLGADAVLHAQDPDFQQKLFQYTGQEGIPVVVDTACTPATLEESVRLASPAGKVICLGLKNQPSAISMADITKKELSILGSRLNNRRFEQVIRHLEDGSFTPQKLVTHRFHYTEIQDAFQLIIEHPESTLKVILSFS